MHFTVWDHLVDFHKICGFYLYLPAGWIDPFVVGSPSTPFCFGPIENHSYRIISGVDIDPEYCQMAARYLKAENSGLFSTASLHFEKAGKGQAAMVMEDQALYNIKPAKKKLS